MGKTVQLKYSETYAKIYSMHVPNTMSDEEIKELFLHRMQEGEFSGPECCIDSTCEIMGGNNK